MENQIIRYVKGRHGKLVGCVMAMTFPSVADQVFVTGSLCRTGVDVFSKKTAVALAQSRAESMAFKGRVCQLPFSLYGEVEHMADRASRYFRCRTIVLPSMKSNYPISNDAKELDW